MEIVNKADLNAEANFNVKDRTMKRKAQYVRPHNRDREVNHGRDHEVDRDREVDQSKVRPNRDKQAGESRILEAMKRMQDEMDRKLELRLTALERERGPGPIDLVTTSDALPFTRDILEFKLPKDFKQPRMRLYDGTTDPVDFLNNFARFRRGPFLFNVNKFPPKSYEDLVSEAYRHAIAEEMTYDAPEGKDLSQPGVGDKQREDQNDVREKPDYKKGRFENSRRGGKDRDQPQNLFRPRFNNYTPSNTNREKGQKDPNRYCRYHRKNGHTTNQCYELQDEIEALIRRGRLSQFVGEKKQAEPHDNAPYKHPRATKDINVISGGATLAGDSNKARKEYARRTLGGLEALSIGPGYWTPKSPKLGYSAITFNEEEEKCLVYPHDDPFIIQAEIANYCVKWVFIDTCSSMEISLEELKPVVTPLLGFTRDNINSIGSVTLPLSLGTAPQRTTVYTTFLIVECPSDYNVILGWPALCSLRAFIASHMLLMKSQPKLVWDM
ncbi:hypothetical protein PRUPE_2G075200 [Prunus persica]|uniref:Retrotransposon gag domain-containing protein n=1 Tax=Prunus persica TaxID=3760 RepID=A0A251QG13_PRUPE|nr:hypothetical protein PRUPE_2G075200 [Prunus persica]